MSIGPFLPRFFPSGKFPAGAGAWGFSSPGADFVLPLAELHQLPVGPILQPAGSLRMAA